MTEPNVLILDEPTNDLDIETLTSLEDVLDGWAGTLSSSPTTATSSSGSADHQVALLGDGRCATCPAASRSTSASAPPPYRRCSARVRALDRADVRLGSSHEPSAPAAPERRRDPRRPQGDVADRAPPRPDQRGGVPAARRDGPQAADHQVVLRLDADLRALQRERDDLEADWLSAAETAG